MIVYWWGQKFEDFRVPPYFSKHKKPAIGFLRRGRGEDLYDVQVTPLCPYG